MYGDMLLLLHGMLMFSKGAFLPEVLQRARDGKYNRKLTGWDAALCHPPCKD